MPKIAKTTTAKSRMYQTIRKCSHCSKIATKHTHQHLADAKSLSCGNDLPKIWVAAQTHPNSSWSQATQINNTNRPRKSQVKLRQVNCCRTSILECVVVAVWSSLFGFRFSVCCCCCWFWFWCWVRRAKCSPRSRRVEHVLYLLILDIFRLYLVSRIYFRFVVVIAICIIFRFYFAFEIWLLGFPNFCVQC